MTPFKTPQQMLFEQAHLPHYSGAKGSLVKEGADILSQFSGRIENAIKQYIRATGQAPSAEEVKQLEDHVLSLAKPSPKPTQTQARLAQQEPYANKLVDQSGRVYGTMPHPQTGVPVTPERAMAPEMRDQFGSTPSNYSVRSATMEPPHVNAFPEDDFMSMANTGRTSERSWNKSYTPSTEDLAQRQHMSEDVGMQIDDGTDLGGLAQARVSEGDIPKMTSGSAPFAERSAELEAGPLNRISSEILQGKHANAIQNAIADFRSRGIEPDREDILNAINAQVNPLRHNYTGENPIAQRPSLPSGARSTPEMDQWRDQMRMSGQPETTVTTHPSDWNAGPKREYLLDAETRQPFAEGWDINELEDKRRRVPKKAEGGMMSPRDMQAHMMVNGYGRGGMPAKKSFDPEYGLGRAVAQGLTMGWSDEMEAAARAAAGQGTYDKNLSLLNKSRDKFDTEHPYVSGGAEFVGSLPYTALPVAGAMRAAAAAKNLPKLARMAVAGAPLMTREAAIGAVTGAGQADPGNRIENAEEMALWNAGANVLGGAAAMALKPAFNTVKNAVRRPFMNSEAKLAEKVAGKPFDYAAGMAAPSSAEKQEWIGKAHAKGAEAFDKNDPAYKAAVFNAWRKANPDLINQTGAQNYDQLMKASYGAASRETGEQFKALPNKVEFWTDPQYTERDYLYRAKQLGMSPAELMRKELAEGKPMQVYKDTMTEKNPGHPYLAEFDPEVGANANEKFRAVHDYFGHLGPKTPNQFGPKGEENAWLAHRQMYSPLAEPAVTAETRGQNSYVNYVDPENVALRAQKKPTVNFAQNKPVLLPPEASNPEYLGGLPRYMNGIVK